jgi:hypothetical protein
MKILAGLIIAVMAGTANADVARDVQCSSIFRNASVKATDILDAEDRQLYQLTSDALERRALRGIQSQGIDSAEAAIMLEGFIESYDALYDEHMTDSSVLVHFLQDCQPEAVTALMGR